MNGGEPSYGALLLPVGRGAGSAAEQCVRRFRPAASSPASTRAPTPRAASGRRRPASTRRWSASSALDGHAHRRRERHAEPARRQLPAHASRSTATSSGARARCDGDTTARSEWKYVPVRRLALFLEESLYRGTQWVVFEPNDEPLWAQIRLNVGAFMQSLFRQGAFQGTTPREAYFVKCDSETTTQDDIDLGIVNILVGFAPLKPAEFVVIQIQQIAGAAAERRRRQLDGHSSRVNPQRFDPYKNFKFRVKWDGRYVAGVSKVSRAQAHDRGRRAPRGRRSVDAPQVARPHRSTRRSRSSAASRTTPSSRSWANKVWNFGSGLGAEVSLKDFRKDIIIEVYNEAGQLAIAYKVFRCWVSEYQALPDLDANANAVAIQHIKLENEGWERDFDVTEPTEPSFTEPPRRRARPRCRCPRAARCGSAAAGAHLDRACCCRSPPPRTRRGRAGRAPVGARRRPAARCGRARSARLASSLLPGLRRAARVLVRAPARLAGRAPAVRPRRGSTAARPDADDARPCERRRRSRRRRGVALLLDAPRRRMPLPSPG